MTSLDIDGDLGVLLLQVSHTLPPPVSFCSAVAIAAIKDNHPLQTANICASIMSSVVSRAADAAIDRDTSLVARDIFDELLRNVHIVAEKRMFSENIILREKARVASASTKDLHDEISGLREQLERCNFRVRVHSLGRIRAAAVQTAMIAELKGNFDQEVKQYEQACLERVAAAEAEAARSYDVVEERDKRLRFLWWKDDLRSMKADEANTLRFQMFEAIFKMTMRTSNAVMGMTNEANARLDVTTERLSALAGRVMVVRDAHAVRLKMQERMKVKASAAMLALGLKSGQRVEKNELLDMLRGGFNEPSYSPSKGVAARGGFAATAQSLTLPKASKMKYADTVRCNNF